MELNNSLLIDAFILVTLPIALAVGCTSNGQQMVEQSVAAAVSAETLDQSEFIQNDLPWVYLVESQNSETVPVQGVSLRIRVPDKSVFNFASNQTDVSEADYGYLRQHADFLKRNPSLTLFISGHADQQGDADYNLRLSLKRAMHVYDKLLAYGVPDSQMIVESYGDTFPLYSEIHLDENRRVELQYAKQASLELL